MSHLGRRWWNRDQERIHAGQDMCERLPNHQSVVCDARSPRCQYPALRKPIRCLSTAEAKAPHSLEKHFGLELGTSGRWPILGFVHALTSSTLSGEPRKEWLRWRVARPLNNGAVRQFPLTFAPSVQQLPHS